MLEQFFYFIVNTTKPLYTIIYQGPYFFIDYWSFVHLINGVLLTYFFIKIRLRHPFVLLLSLLMLWEVTELTFTYLAIKVFLPEIIGDQFTDIVIGFGGGAIVWLAYTCSQGKLRFVLQKYVFDSFLLIQFFVAIAMALIWVGYYEYKYNIPSLNSSHINWFAFILWSGWLFITISMYSIINKVVNDDVLSLVITWIIYFPLLLIFEYVGYYVLKIRSVTTDGPFIFGLIHGSTTLKCFYLTAGVLAILLTKMLTNLVANKSKAK